MTNYGTPNTEIIQYANNTLIFAADKNPSTATEVIETQIERLCSYFEQNKLQLNALKTEFVILSKHASPGNLKLSINLGEKTIHASKYMKWLRKSMDCDMSFQLQIKTTLRNMVLSIPTLHQIRKSLRSKTRILLFKTLVLCQLEFPASELKFAMIYKSSIGYLVV